MPGTLAITALTAVAQPAWLDAAVDAIDLLIRNHGFIGHAGRPLETRVKVVRVETSAGHAVVAHWSSIINGDEDRYKIQLSHPDIALETGEALGQMISELLIEGWVVPGSLANVHCVPEVFLMSQGHLSFEIVYRVVNALSGTNTSIQSPHYPSR